MHISAGAQVRTCRKGGHLPVLKVRTCAGVDEWGCADADLRICEDAQTRW
jgi:hypothetical protein